MGMPMRIASGKMVDFLQNMICSAFFRLIKVSNATSREHRVLMGNVAAEWQNTAYILRLFEGNIG